LAKQIKHLTRAEKRKLIIDRLKIAPELSDRAIARMVGVSPTTVGTLRREFTDKTVQNGQVDTSDYDWTQHEYLRQNPDLLIGMSEASLRAIKVEGVLSLMQQRNSRSPRYCQRLLYEERKKANKSPAITVTEDDVEIFVGDIRTGLPQIKDESVDLIFTDPPYNYQAVSELYHHIASVAGRVLVDGGSLAVMCGGTFLDVALRELSTDKRLKFNWNIAYVTPRGTPLVHSRKVATAVKHILWFVKGGKYEGKIVYDLIEVPPDPENADKIPHIWGQSIQGVQEVLRRLSTGGVVCDVMCGGGSTVVAALELGGRKVIACDIDEEAVKTTKTRVRRLFGHTK
jgi:16S rRNA G966 N2-methylase RsmD